MLETDVAYIAGMIDADGWISISRALKQNRGRCKPSIYHALRVGIAGTNAAPHELAKKLFGGNITRYAAKKENHQPNHQWNTSGPTAERILSLILPFLLIKRQNAVVGIKFQKLIYQQREQQKKEQKPPYRITDFMRQERDSLWREMIALNHPRVYKIGHKHSGHLLDGKEWRQIP